jgi:acetolactate synthase-1/2/3 large subunit
MTVASHLTRPANGADAVAHALKAAGVARVFALCGDHVNTLFHAVHRAGIDIVGARHESAAVQMADGSARATGKPGVAIVTGGPGHTNAVTGAAVAQGAQSPVVIISGQAPKARRERGGNQSLHQADIMRPVTKWAIEAESSASLGELTLRALLTAACATPGAVSLSIPVDVADDAVDDSQTPRTVHVGAERAASAVDIARTAELMLTATKPVLVLGGSAHQHTPCSQLAAAVRALGLPVFTNGHARGAVADDGEFCFGHASPLFNAMFRSASEADLWLIAGTAVDYNIANVVSDRARVIQIHCDPRQLGIGRVPDCALEGRPSATLSALAAACSARPPLWNAWRAAMQSRYRAQQEYWAGATHARANDRRGVHPAALCRALHRYHTPDTTLVVDVGDFVNWPKAYFPAIAPARYMDGGSLGNLGGALPIAIGAAIARPDQPVWAFSGDGGFGFHSWELSLAAERRLPLTIIVGNDRAWGTEKRLQIKSHQTDLACDLPDIRYADFAKLLGVASFRVSRADELDATLAELNACAGPRLLEVELPALAGRPYADPLEG